MGFKEDISRRIDRKRAEIVELEDQLKTARTYLLAFEEMYKLASRDSTSPAVRPEPKAPNTSFRSGSMTGRAYAVLKKAGRPLHVNELLPEVGKTLSRADRSAISGTLGAYVRNGTVFTRPGPNTFGLVEFVEPTTVEPVPPPGFGKTVAESSIPSKGQLDAASPVVTDDDIPF